MKEEITMPKVYEETTVKIYLWNNQGNEITFNNMLAFKMRARFVGESSTPGVNMFSIDGILYFTRNV